MDKDFEELKKVKINKWNNLEQNIDLSQIILNLKDNELLHVHLLMRFY